MHNCERCRLTFKSKKTLQKHLTSKKHEDGNPEKKYKCNCGLSFHFRQGLHKHKQSCTFVLPSEDNSQIESESSQNIIDAKVSQLELELTNVLSRVSQLEEKIKRQPTIIYKDSKRCKIPDHVRLDICTKQNGQCKGCDQVLGDFFQLDHIVALRFGGTNDVTNLQALCGQCHNEKSALESIHQLEIQEAVSTILEKHKESRRLTMPTS